MIRALAILLVATAACASKPAPSEEMPAVRGDVAAALYKQFDEVLERRIAIRDDEGAEAQKEREELDRLADEIAVRLVRIDPDADVDALVKKLEAAR